MARKVYGTNKRGRSWKWSRTRPDGDAEGRAEISTRHGFGWDASPDTGVGVPANAWRFSHNNPVRRAEGGYWLRAAA